MKGGPSAGIVVLLTALLLPLTLACGSRATTTPPRPGETLLPSPTPQLVLTAQPTPVPTATPTQPRASFYGAPCPFVLPPGQDEGQTVDCGYLTVPEDRADPQSRTIRLAVAILHPDGDPEPDPIIYLQGGPGASALKLMQYTFASQFEPVLAARRDIIVFDQRGVGFSKPALECSKMAQLRLDLMDEEIDGRHIGEEEALNLVVDSALTCRDELSATAELPAYETAASAADVEDLRAALGYGQINLWGTSYGTWLALEVLRRYPDGIRSVVLDAVYPPDVDLLAETPANAARSIDLLFESCAAREACHSAFPNLRGVYSASVEQLNAEPAEFEITNPLTRQSYDVVMTGDNLAAFLFQSLYVTDVIPSLPQILWDAGQGNYTAVARLMGTVLATGQAVSSGQQISVLCHDEIAFGSAERFETSIAEHPELARAFQSSILGEMGVRLCASWQAGRADVTLTQGVESDVPALIMSGEFDPVTPPAWGRHVADTLPNSIFFEYPGVGHGASAVAGCPQEMMIAFLANPAAAPDGACIDGMAEWRFVVPAEQATIEMVPFTSSTFGIQGMVPKGWTETDQPGAYARRRSAVDIAAVIEQAAAMSASDLLERLSGQRGLGAAPASVGQREAHGLTWRLYALEVQAVSIDLALTESGGKAMFVLLQCDPDEHATLYETVFLPAVDALMPVQ